MLEAAGLLTEDRLWQPFPIGQGSIWKSLLHMHAAEYVWLETLLGNEEPLLPGDAPGKLPGNQEGAGRIESLDELKARWRQLDQRGEEYLSILDDNFLDEIVY